MEPLKPRQRAHLKSLAHPLKPVFQIGRDGVTDTVAQTVREAFNARELLKVKVLGSSPQSAREAAEELAARLPDAQVVQVIGRTVVLYRAYPEQPEIRLPD